jgi:hypothetical protein
VISIKTGTCEQPVNLIPIYGPEQMWIYSRVFWREDTEMIRSRSPWQNWEKPRIDHMLHSLEVNSKHDFK